MGMPWANIGHTYERTINNWKQLCPKCHKKIDIEFKNYTNASG